MLRNWLPPSLKNEEGSGSPLVELIQSLELLKSRGPNCTAQLRPELGLQARALVVRGPASQKLNLSKS
jgi:hypothetical protein